MLPNDSSLNQRQTYLNQYGFTLIELLIVVAIIGIIASIVLPSYQAYLIKNREAELQSKLLSLSTELEQWRAKALSYKGFEPKSGYSGTDSTIDFPETNAKYTISVRELNSVSGTTSAKQLNDAQARGTNWVLMATPKDSTSDDRYFKLTSQGMRCVNNISFAITDAGCGAGEETW